MVLFLFWIVYVSNSHSHETVIAPNLYKNNRHQGLSGRKKSEILYQIVKDMKKGVSITDNTDVY